MQRKIIKTADGSDTITIDELDVTYHSRHGAVEESMHVFINAGLDYFHKQHPEQTNIRLFEMGLGTGLNVLLSCAYVKGENISIEYTAIEQHPLTGNEFTGLNYVDLVEGINIELFERIHDSSWGMQNAITDKISLHKVHDDLKNYTTSNKYDVVYYDAFAPAAQPELWTVDVFSKLYNMMSDNGVLVTYCSKGIVRRAMISAGFTVEKLQGPPGKREMLRARKTAL